jgi:catechol 2,3-dioxygenase-like lactoylglutathione lyase family enzyme
MYLSHVNISIPKGSEQAARDFYIGLLGLREVAKPAAPAQGGLWLDAGGLELHLSAGEERDELDSHLHFGLGCGDVDGVKARLRAAGLAVADQLAPPRKQFFVHDPFGNRVEIHAPGEGWISETGIVSQQPMKNGLPKGAS